MLWRNTTGWFSATGFQTSHPKRFNFTHNVSQTVKEYRNVITRDTLPDMKSDIAISVSYRALYIIFTYIHSQGIDEHVHLYYIKPSLSP